MEELILKLYEIGAIKFGRFVFVSGISAPNYVDLRILPSFPRVLAKIADLMFEAIAPAKGGFSFLAPVPYAAIPLACAISVRHNIPMLLVRKEPHKTGTKKLIEGVFKKGDRVLMVDDVITNASSKLKFIKKLEDEGLKVGGVVTFLDRNQGGDKKLREAGYPYYKVCDLVWMLKVLHKHEKISKKTLEENLDWLAKNQF